MLSRWSGDFLSFWVLPWRRASAARQEVFARQTAMPGGGMAMSKPTERGPEKPEGPVEDEQ